MLTATLFGSMLLLFALSVPIAFGVGLAAAAAILVMPKVSLEVIVQRMFYGLDSFLILSVPLFLLFGELMESAQITDRLVNFTLTVIGRLRGGLGHVTVATECVLSGVTGSGAGDAAALGGVLVPAMVNAGYQTPYAAALVGAASVLGPIIPPSIIMVVYASIANVSVGRMFLGGFGPGVLAATLLMILTSIIARRRNIPAGRRSSFGEIVGATRRAALVLVAPFIVIAGIVGGLFTATESAGIACVYALVLGLAIYRTLSLSDLPTIFLRTVLTTGQVMFVLATASVFSWILARGDVPAQFARLPFFSDPSRPWVILIALNVLLLILGCLMDSLAILLIITPMILPIATRAGIDPIHLGVVMAVNLSIGLITPPFGSAMFVLMGISRCSMMEFAKEAWPYIVILIVALVVMTYTPGVVLFLPDLLMGRG
jgi:tripartite ATP-independent transporter DctM subunit